MTSGWKDGLQLQRCSTVCQELGVCGVVDSSMVRKVEIKIRYALKVKHARLPCKTDVDDRVRRICDGSWIFSLSK